MGATDYLDLIWELEQCHGPSTEHLDLRGMRRKGLGVDMMLQGSSYVFKSAEQTRNMNTGVYVCGRVFFISKYWLWADWGYGRNFSPKQQPKVNVLLHYLK